MATANYKQMSLPIRQRMRALNTAIEHLEHMQVPIAAVRVHTDDILITLWSNDRNSLLKGDAVKIIGDASGLHCVMQRTYMYNETPVHVQWAVPYVHQPMPGNVRRIH